MNKNAPIPGRLLPKRLLRRRDVQGVTGLSRSVMYALMAKGHFPKAISLVPGGRCVAWDADEIEAWVNSRICAGKGA